MTAKLNTLIDKQDNNEIVRDQIAAILAVEEANQEVLALAAGEDPDLFGFDVYIEKSRPFEVLTDSTDGSEIGELKKGVVNVLFDNDTFDNRNSDLTYRQKVKGIFYIDCYAHKNTTSEMSGDEATSKESDRIARLVRNIIMSATYFQLALGNREFGHGNNIVYSRRITRREKFLPTDKEGKIFESVIATRLTLEVEYEEFAPQIDTRDLDLIITTCKKDSITGQIYFEVENDFTE